MLTVDEEALMGLTVFRHLKPANDNQTEEQRFPYAGICLGCQAEQYSNDPDVLCLSCGDAVEYVLRTLPT